MNGTRGEEVFRPGGKAGHVATISAGRARGAGPHTAWTEAGSERLSAGAAAAHQTAHDPTPSDPDTAAGVYLHPESGVLVKI